jgi:hypothetical protein
MEFINDDFPTLDLPEKAISGILSSGREFILLEAAINLTGFEKSFLPFSITSSPKSKSRLLK